VVKGIDNWTIKRRYNHFREELYNKKPPAGQPQANFPPKTFWSDDEVAAKRQTMLQRFLQTYIHCVVTASNSPLLQVDAKEALVQLVPFLDPKFNPQEEAS